MEEIKKPKGRPSKSSLPQEEISAKIEESFTPQESPVAEEIKLRVKQQTKTVDIPNSELMPKIIAGVCEFCGERYEKCQHYKNIAKDITCSYCLRKDIIDARELLVYKLLDSNELIVLCSDYSCQEAHLSKYGLLAI